MMATVTVYNTSNRFSPRTLENGQLLDTSLRIKDSLAITESGKALRVQTEGPHLISLGSGRLSTAITIHPIPQGTLFVGPPDSVSSKDITIQGIGIEDQHCFIENNGGVVTLYPQAGAVSIDGNRVDEPTVLTQGSMLCLGKSNFFRFNNPMEAHIMRESIPSNGNQYTSPSMIAESKTYSGQKYLDGVDFVEKVSKFEYLSHSQSPPITSQDTPKWFVNEGIRIAQQPSLIIPKTSRNRSSPSEHSLKIPSPKAHYFDTSSHLVKPGFSTPPPYHCSFTHNLKSASPKLLRVYSQTPDPVVMSRRSPRSMHASFGLPNTPLAHGCHTHVSADNLKMCEVELHEQHRKAVQERLKDQEQERQERLRLEEILHLCAEYEENSHHPGITKEKPIGDDNDVPFSSSDEFAAISSERSPESTNSSNNSKNTKSSENNFNVGCHSDGVLLNKEDHLPKSPLINPSAAQNNSVLPTNDKANGSAVYASGGYFGVPNRIKTNGSLPRDRNNALLSPSNATQGYNQMPNADYVSPGGTTMYMNQKTLNSASSEDELCAILGNNSVPRESPTDEHISNGTYMGNTTMNCPQSPRIRIRTVAGLAEKGPEVYENRSSSNEHAKNKVAHNVPNLEGLGASPLNSSARLDNDSTPRNVSVNLEEIQSLQKERQSCLQAIGAIKQKVSELDIQKTEFINEHGLEHALLAGELKTEEERQSFESSRISELQTRKLSIEQKCVITQEELEMSKDKVLQQEKIVQDLEEELALIKLKPTNPFIGDLDEKLENLNSQKQLLDIEKKAFEDLEFQHLETQSHREEEKDALSQEIECLTDVLTQRQVRLNELALQKLKLVTQLEKVKYSFECQLKTYTEELQNDVCKLESVSEKLRSLIKPSYGLCFSEESSPRTSDSDFEMQKNGGWNGQAFVDPSETVPVNHNMHVRGENCNSFNSFESETSSLTSSDTGDCGRRHEDQVKPAETSEEFDTTTNKVRQRELALQNASQDHRPLVGHHHQHENGCSEVRRREKQKAQRPLTRYLPIRNSEFDLRQHIESAGHQIELCPHINLTPFSCHGYLHKLGGKWRTWKKRWFVFDRNQRVLLYFGDKNESKLKGGIYFQVIEEVYVDHLQSVKSPSPHSTFCVKTYDRVYYLMAPTPEAMRVWVDVIFTGAEGYLDFLAEGE